MSHALGDAFSPFLVGVLSDWIRPALKPLDTTVPIVNVSANVLPYGAPIFNNDDMVEQNAAAIEVRRVIAD